MLSAVQEVLELVDRSLCDLYYLYAKSCKKHRELKNLFSVLEGQFEIYSAGVRPMKATETSWIDHKICAMGLVVEKIGLCNQHLRNVISTAANAKVSATLNVNMQN